MVVARDASPAMPAAQPMSTQTTIARDDEARAIVGTGHAGSDAAAESHVVAFLAGLLALQADLLGAIAGAAYLSGGSGRRPGVVARFAPRGGPGERVLGALMPRLEKLAAELCAARVQGAPSLHGRAEIMTLPPTGSMYGAEPAHRVLATPLVSEGVTQGACVLVMPASAERPAGEERALTLLALTNARFEAFLWRRQAFDEAEQRTRLGETLTLLDAAQQGRDAGTMGSLMCHELARKFACTRVSLGLVRGESIEVIAVSGSDSVDRRAEAITLIEACMDECADQDAEIVYPSPEAFESDPAQRRVTRAHATLAARLGACSLLTLPLRTEGDLVGVAMLERPANDPFPAQAVALVRLAAEFAGPALWTRRLADRGILGVARDRALEFARVLVGPTRTGAKLIALLIALVVLAAALVPIPSRVQAEFEARATISRVVVAPFAGYLESVAVRPGDAVKSGQVLAAMDRRVLDKDIAALELRREQLQFQRDEAQTQGELAKQRIYQAQIGETDANLAKLRGFREHAAITSPIEGAIGRGDLEKLIGASVDPTQALFEVIGHERLAVVKVDERDVGRVKLGQEGTLTIRALPGRELPIRVARVTPTAQVERGANVFLVECAIDAQTPELLPGMTGTARLDDGWTTTLARLLRPLADEARLRLWW